MTATLEEALAPAPETKAVEEIKWVGDGYHCCSTCQKGSSSTKPNLAKCGRTRTFGWKGVHPARRAFLGIERVNNIPKT